YHYTGPETGPDVDLRPELQLLSLTPLAARVVSRLRQAHDPIHMTGADWAMPLGGFTLRAEAAWLDDRPYLRRSSDLIAQPALARLPLKQITRELLKRHRVAVPLGALFPSFDTVEWGAGADYLWHGYQPLLQVNQIAFLEPTPPLVVNDPETRLVASHRVPDGPDHGHFLPPVEAVVDVVSTPAEQDSPDATHAGRSVRRSGLGSGRNSPQCLLKLFYEERRRVLPVDPPPLLDRPDLRLGSRCDEDPRPTHDLARLRSARTSDAGRTRPLRTSSSEAASAAWRRRRSSSSKPSHASAGTSSISVPSGRSVGSSTTMRPPFTRAFRGFMIYRSLAREGGSPQSRISPVRT